MSLRHILVASVIGLSSLPAVVQAHYVWIESETPSRARIYFGEFNEGVREKAGGRLEERAALEAWLERPDRSRQTLRLAKLDDHFSAPLERATGWLLARDLTSEVKDYRKHHIGIVKPMFYARAAVANHAEAPAGPSLDLDILPVAAGSGALQVFFKGQALGAAKVLVYAPNLWMQELKSDEGGRFTPRTPWPGRYVVDVVHEEAKPGEFRGQRYEAVRHRMTFSFIAGENASAQRTSPGTPATPPR